MENSNGIAHGWAVKDHTGKLLIETVFFTERGAKVNWLVAQRLCNIASYTPDEEIVAAFKHFAFVKNATLIRVTITEQVQ